MIFFVRIPSEILDHTCPWFFVWPWLWLVQYCWHYSFCLFSDLGSHIYDIYSGFVAVRSSLLRPIIQEGDKSSWDPLVGAEYWPWWPLSRLLLLRCHIQILSILALHKVCISAYLHLHDLWGCWVRTFLRYILLLPQAYVLTELFL